MLPALFTIACLFLSTQAATPAQIPTTIPVSDPLTIPTLGDWDSGSLAFSRGAEGEWDYILWGGFVNSLIKKGDT